jgi:hypothetical protein
MIKEKIEVKDARAKHIDSSLNYPTYGKTIDPSMEIDTYMINKGMC